MNKKGFTLIELLAVILILGAIALIAIPTVNKVVNGAKKESLKTTTSNILISTVNRCQKEQLKGDNITSTYYIENDTVVPSIDISGKVPSSGVINVNENCDTEMFAVNDNYCSIKNYGDDTVYSGVLENGNCNLDNGTTVDKVVETTPQSCFTYTQDGVITGYDFDNTSCPSNITIPAEINGVKITKIGDGAFVYNYDYLIFYNEAYNFYDTVNNLPYYASIISVEEQVIGSTFPIKAGTNTIKTCQKTDGTYEEKSIDYQLNGTDGYTMCMIVPDKTNSNGRFNIVYNDNIDTLKFSEASNLTSIGYAAFFGNSINHIDFGSVPISLILSTAFSDNYISGTLDMSKLSKLNSIDTSVFEYNMMESVIFPDSLKVIGSYSFSNNESLANIKFSSSLEYIGVDAFYNNTNLTELVIPGSVKTVDYAAFANNTSLRKVKFNNSPAVLEIASFADCNSLTTVDFGSSISYIGDYAFNGDNLDSLFMPNTLEYIGRNAFQYNNIGNINFSNKLAYLGINAFDQALTVTNITLPSSLTKIDQGAFGHNNLTSVNFNEGLKTISNWAFIDNKLVSIVLPNSVTTLNDGAFADNTTLTSFTFGSGLTYLSSLLFRNCGLTIIDIPSNIKTINGTSFSGCKIKTFNINKASDSITGSPWGMSGATVNWLG